MNERKYYYARLNGKRVYCGEGKTGYEKAKLVRAELKRKQKITELYKHGHTDEARAREAEEKKRKREHFKSFAELLNWFMTLPQVEAQRGYPRKVNSAVHLLNYFGGMHPGDIEGDTTEYYREQRKNQGAAENTVNNELALLSVTYTTAIKRKKLPADCKPGEIVIVDDRNPRPIVTDAQYKKLLEGASPDLKDILIGAYESAMRSGGLCNLRVGQINLDAVLSQVPPVKADYLDLGIFRYQDQNKAHCPRFSRLQRGLTEKDGR